MEQDALISVIVPVYNAKETLNTCLDSVVGQSYTRLDIVLVDDGSTDGSGEICDEYAARDSRVRVVHQANGGLSAARNTGLAAAHGEYICWLDSDDRFMPTMVEKLYGAIKRHGLRVAMCNYGLDRPDVSIKPRYEMDFEERVYPRETIVGFILGLKLMPVMWANLMDRRLYEGIRFPEGKLFEDVRNSYKLHERANGCVFLSEVLLVRYPSPEGLSHVPNLGNRIDACYAYIERYRDAVQRWPERRQDMLVAAARHLRILRYNVFKNPPSRFMEYRGEIRDICGFYRRHTAEILPKDAGPVWRLEFWLVTSGSYVGLFLSMLIDGAASKLGGQQYLRRLKPPNLPPY